MKNKSIELADTGLLMVSESYKDRFRAEYYQLDIRAEKLNKMLNDWRAGKLKFEPTCDYGLLFKQFQPNPDKHKYTLELTTNDWYRANNEYTNWCNRLQEDKDANL